DLFEERLYVSFGRELAVLQAEVEALDQRALAFAEDVVEALVRVLLRPAQRDDEAVRERREARRDRLGGGGGHRLREGAQDVVRLIGAERAEAVARLDARARLLGLALLPR